jgi:hypothetical protein
MVLDSGGGMEHVKCSPEQERYAKFIQKGSNIGMLILLASFAVYMLHILDPFIPVKDLPQYWTMPVDQYLQATGMPHGWGWLGLAGHSDVLTLVGMAWLAALTIFAYIQLIPGLFRRGDKVVGTLAIIEVLVLGLAASGLLAAGH